MKKIFWLFFLFFLLFAYDNLKAYDTSAARYLPLQVGNVWVYYGSSATTACHGTSWYDRYEITGTALVNGRTYFIFSHTIKFISGECGWECPLFQSEAPIRIDSTTMNVYKNMTCPSSGKYLVDSLNAKFGDTLVSCDRGRLVCSDTSYYSLCGINRPAKVFSVAGAAEYNVSQRYAKYIGLVSAFYYCSGSFWINLRGCVINGQLCGDTSTPVAVQNISSEIPRNYSLSQNYPNPFNPVTKIKFDVPNVVNGSDRSLRLVIYDALGREAVTLVNEQLQPGTYEAEWDASNYPSGVYFYRLETNTFSETKKMVLIK